MTVIEYVRVCGTQTVQVRLSYNEENLTIAQNEAQNGAYTLREVADDGLC